MSEPCTKCNGTGAVPVGLHNEMCFTCCGTGKIRPKFELPSQERKTKSVDAADLLLLEAGARSGDLGTLALAAQLAGVPACDHCGYRKEHCRCGEDTAFKASGLYDGLMIDARSGFNTGYRAALDAAAKASRPSFQARVQPWMMECFGPQVSGCRCGALLEQGGAGHRQRC